MAPWSFRNHVQPVLAKAGCSAGACHGAAAGQNGFKLSLRGYDDEGDYLALTHHGVAAGALISRDPGRSLMLLKPTDAVPHKGGKRFDVDSLEYRILSEWIASGHPGPSDDDPRIVRIEISPARSVLLQTGRLPATARARLFHRRPHRRRHALGEVHLCQRHRHPGRRRWARSKMLGYGEGAITAWYLSRIAIATVTVPYTNTVSDEAFAAAQRRNFIDDLVLEKLQSLNLPPSPPASDAEFIRRAFLDTIGVLPTAEEARDFLGRTHRPTNAIELIEPLLKRPEFVDYWSYKWSDLLLVSSRKAQARRPCGPITTGFATTSPPTRRGTSSRARSSPPKAARWKTARPTSTCCTKIRRDMAETISQAFLGMSINCAKCHNHPDGEVDEQPDITAWPTSSLASAPRTAPATASNVIFVVHRRANRSSR